MPQANQLCHHASAFLHCDFALTPVDDAKIASCQRRPQSRLDSYCLANISNTQTARILTLYLLLSQFMANLLNGSRGHCPEGG